MDRLDELLGESASILALRRKVRALLQHLRGARRPPPILVQGETGTGKGLLARLMHEAGPRAKGPFVDVNCAAIPETLLEAELFGYERSAFTDARQSKPGLFHVANGGTLFLDEIGLLPCGLQAKLLTVLEQGSVRRLGATRSEPADVAIIAATNEPLLAAGVDKFYLGDFSGVPTHLTRAIDLYDRARTADLILKYGQDIGVAAWGFLGWAHAVTGDLEGAASHARNMLQLARDIGHPFSLALALFLGSEIHVLRFDRAAVSALAEELVALSREHSFTFFGALGTMFTGWTRVAGGDVRAGLALTREGAELFRVVGQQVGLAHRARLAEAFLVSGAVDEALAATSDALDRWRRTEEAAFVAVHLRLRGEALAQTGDSAGARLAFTEAVDLARRQGAWLFALRAALSLARVDPDSLDVLRPIAERFPAAHDSSDLEAARGLLRAGP